VPISFLQNNAIKD